MRALQMTVIAPSLVNIAQSIGATLADVGWIMAIYATGSLVAQPIAGRFSDARSRRTVFIVTVMIFALGSLICALSTSLPVLITGRIVQSLGAGGIQPAALAFIGQSVPKARQNAALYATYGMFALAGALGAVLGGALIDGGRALAAHALVSGAMRAELGMYPWHLIFWINIPLAIVTVVLALRLEPGVAKAEKVGVDFGALTLITVIAMCLMMAATASSQTAVAWIAGALVSLVALAYWERRARYPFIDPALFASKGPALIYTIALLTGIPIFSITMYGAAYFIAQFHVSAASSGLALLALALPLGAAQGLAGRLAHTRDAKMLLLGGVVLLSCAEIVLATSQSIAGVLIAFALAGFGIGLASAPPSALILRYVDPARSGAAIGLMTMMSSTGAITAPVAISAFLHYSHEPAAHGFRLGFLLAFLIAAACIPIAASLPQPQEAATPQGQTAEVGSLDLSKPRA